jgi:hypothetical protein
MLASSLPLLAFSHTTLPKKEWIGNHQEKKGRVISIEAVRQSMLEPDKEDSSDSDVESKDTAEYRSEDSWNSEEEYEDDEGKGLAEHMNALLPNKAEVGKPQPKLIPPPPPPKKKKEGPGFWGRRWLEFQAWRERERRNRMHYILKDYEQRVKDYQLKLDQELEKEIAVIKKEVIKAAWELKKIKKINSMAVKKKESAVERFDLGIEKRDEEARRINFLTANLQRWAVEKHDQKIADAMLRKAEALEKAEKERKIKEKLDKIEAQRVEDYELVIDVELTQKIAEFGRTTGVLAGTNVFDPVADKLAKDIKAANKRGVRADKNADFNTIPNDPILYLKLLEDIDFKTMKRGGVTSDGKKMLVFAHPDLSKTRHVIELRCINIGERGALSLAAEFVRGACPMMEVLDLTRNQIQTRGLGRLLHGMKIANLMSLKRLVLASNDLTARSMEYLRDAFSGGTFPALEILELQGNEIADEGVDTLLRCFHSKSFEYLRELHLQHNRITDIGFQKVLKTFKSLQAEHMPYLERLGLEGNIISGKAKREFWPLPMYLSV